MCFQCCCVFVCVLVFVVVLVCSVGVFVQIIFVSKFVFIMFMFEQQCYYDIYKELVEINMMYLVGDMIKVVYVMEKCLCDVGFVVVDMQVLELFLKKGNLVLCFKGIGVKKLMLLFVYIDVVEVKCEDWKIDLFKLQEIDGYFIVCGVIDDKVMVLVFVLVLGQFKQEGFKFLCDIILVLIIDEECGDVLINGVYWIVNNKLELVKVEFGINEGGGGELCNGKLVFYCIQVVEKMYMMYELEVCDVGGYSLVLMKMNLIYVLLVVLDWLGVYQFFVKLVDVM